MQNGGFLEHLEVKNINPTRVCSRSRTPAGTTPPRYTIEVPDTSTVVEDYMFGPVSR
ncbi:MAG TPA: hypothetical protein VGO47_09420 [Chlamydiales bacterium]|nr:hypothetical protein [Chlamydiales bacterium]